MRVKKVFDRRFLLIDSARLNSTNSQNITITNTWKHPENIDNFLKSIEKENQRYDGFQKSTASIFLLAQLFGLMPVRNIMSAHVDELKFNWSFLRVLYSIFIVFTVGFLTFPCLIHLLESDISYGKIVHTLFNVISLISLLWFLQFSRKWPETMKKWSKVEEKLTISNKRSEKNKITIRIVAYAFLIFSLIEHILSIIDAVAEVPTCDDQLSVFQAYMFQSSPMVFYYFPYSLSFGIFVKICQTTTTFVWWFNDLFIILMSVGLSSMFGVINDEVQAQKEVKLKN